MQSRHPRGQEADDGEHVLPSNSSAEVAFSPGQAKAQSSVELSGSMMDRWIGKERGSLDARVTKLEDELRHFADDAEDWEHVKSIKMPADVAGTWQNQNIEEPASPRSRIPRASTSVVEMKAQLRYAPPASRVCKIFWSLCCSAFLLIVVVLGVVDTGARRQPMFTNTTDLPGLTPSGASLAFDIGRQRQSVHQAAILVAVAALGCVFSVITPAFVITFNPDKTPPEFWRKGTLSNVAQDTNTPHGRIFCINLFLAALLSFISMYPFWLYRSWIPGLTKETNPLGLHAFEPQMEVAVRCFWVTVPFVGLMVHATIPPTPVIDAYTAVQTWFHNVCATGSMLMLVSLEFLQLSYGEHALQYFFSDEEVFPPYYGRLTTFQRSRVLVAILALSTCFPFAVFQLYLLGGEIGLWKAHSSYNRALISFYAEIVGMVSIFTLPLLAAVEEVLLQNTRAPVLLEAKQFLKYWPWNEM